MADGSIGRERPHFGAADAELLLRIAEVATPGGLHVRAPDARTVADVEKVLERFGEGALAIYVQLLRALDLAAIPVAGRRLWDLEPKARLSALLELDGNVATFQLVRLATGPIKIAQVSHVDFPESLGGKIGLGLAPTRIEPRRWDERVLDAGDLADCETIEVDAVIVGSGAGGAPLAHALASRGHAVMVLEAGGFFDRRDFQGRPFDRFARMHEQHLAVGNAVIVLPTGSMVGGTTTINSGTCFRTPPDVMRRWRFEDGLDDVDPLAMEPHFQRVEAMLQIGPNDRKHLGQIAAIVARGADALGWSHHPLPRNAPDCDGQGVCCFGCPTDAKRSTNVSYLPAALDRGAMLMHHARVEEVLLAGGRAVGVVARATHGERGRVRVLAKTVVLSGGALQTPAMLLRLGLANSSGMVGKGLTVHPCSAAWAYFDEPIRGWAGVPQGYGIDEFAREGIRFEGGFMPIDISAPTLPVIGEEWTRFVDRYDHMASFGYMIADSSRGRVVLGPRGEPEMLYVVNDHDRRRILRGQTLLARLFMAAGSDYVLTSIKGVGPLRTLEDVEALERSAGSIGAHRLDLAAFHPLGTCRMGKDAKRSVVGPTNETHDVAGLFIVDGSTINGPLGVNPQVTIMAMSERAAAFVERSLERPTGRDAAPATTKASSLPAFEFTETMSGRCTFLGTSREAATAFTVRCQTEDAGRMFRRLFDAEGGVLELVGTTIIDGFVTRRTCTGTLAMHPRKRRGTLVYDLDFEADDGLAYHLHGEKDVALSSVLSGMTTLATEIARASDGVPVARGTLRFALTDLVPWLATFRLRRRRSRASA